MPEPGEPTEGGPQQTAAELIVKYTSMGILHRCSFNFAEELGANEITEFMSGFVAAHQGLMRQADAVQGADYRAAGSDFTVPIAYVAQPGLAPNNSTWADDPESTFLSMVGRSLSTGKRVRHMFFTPCSIGLWPNDNRFRAGEYEPATAYIQAFLNFMTGNLSNLQFPAPTADDGSAVVWYPYFNYARSAYWQRKQRT